MKYICIVLLFLTTLLKSCNYNYINFNEYIINDLFFEKEIVEDKIYLLNSNLFKARITNGKEATIYSIYNNPIERIILFRLNYWTEIKLQKIINTDGFIWVNIKTEDNKTGWIKSNFIELEKRKFCR